ncbi:disA bacterial checkpoint controller nucleotide-binding domain-containing protein [Ditylenchus destructor]|nr:disA bacterial checkpoint controller nucleotide-binding domain-containing protein [Ditylenchus destructor]
MVPSGPLKRSNSEAEFDTFFYSFRFLLVLKIMSGPMNLNVTENAKNDESGEQIREICNCGGKVTVDMSTSLMELETRFEAKLQNEVGLLNKKLSEILANVDRRINEQTELFEQLLGELWLLRTAVENPLDESRKRIKDESKNSHCFKPKSFETPSSNNFTGGPSLTTLECDDAPSGSGLSRNVITHANANTNASGNNSGNRKVDDTEHSGISYQDVEFPQNLDELVQKFLSETVDVAFEMAEDGIGGTIILCNEFPVTADFMLMEISKFGKTYNAPYSPEAVKEIFRDHSSCLHDGGLILSVPERRIHSGANKIPADLSDYSLGPEAAKMKDLGLRHWSAFCLCRSTNASVVTLVVSEDQGWVSVFHKANVTLNMKKDELKELLWNEYLLTKEGMYSRSAPFDLQHFSSTFSVQIFDSDIHKDWSVECYAQCRLQLPRNTDTVLNIPEQQISALVPNLTVKPGTKDYSFAQYAMRREAESLLNRHLPGIVIRYGYRALGGILFDTLLQLPFMDKGLFKNEVFAQYLRNLSSKYPDIVNCQFLGQLLSTFHVRPIGNFGTPDPDFMDKYATLYYQTCCYWHVEFAKEFVQRGEMEEGERIAKIISRF